MISRIANTRECLALSILLSFYLGIPGLVAAATEKSPKEQVTELVTKMNAAASPLSALALLDEAEATMDLDETSRSRLTAQRVRFEELLANEQVKLAGRWVTPAELRAAVAASDAKISQGFEAITQQDGKAALEAFEAAVRAYPEGIRARFLLGMAFSSKGNFNARKAAQYFESVVDRCPNHWPAVNNLALSQFRMGNHGGAFSLWKGLLEENPEFPEAVHNVKRIVREVDQGRIRFTGTTKSARNIATRADLFRSLAESLPDRSRVYRLPLNRPGVGWLYAPLVEGTAEREFGGERLHTVYPLESEQVVSGTSGTGVIIGRNLILTTQAAVVDDVLGRTAQVLVHSIQNDEVSSVLGRVVAMSPREGLALVMAELKPDKIPVRLADNVTPQDDFVLMEARPRFVLDGQVAVSPATIGLLPPERAGVMLFSTKNSGLCGAALVNARGHLVGICDSHYFGQISTRQKAIATPQIRAWLRSINRLPDVTSESVDQPSSPETSVVRLTGLFPASQLGLVDVLPAVMRHARSEFEDQSCVHCNGLGFVPCSARGCAGGSVTNVDVMSAAIILPNSHGTLVIPKKTARQSQCNVCSGDGRLRCPVCRSKGINPDIR